MSKKLVAYFSASGVTEDAAKKIAKAADADLYEIRPETPYTQADLNWQDKQSRSSVEMSHKELRPALADKDAKISDYDVIFLGFPVWWYTAPTIVNSFLESYDFSGKRIILFATSGSSGFGSALDDLKKSVSSEALIEEGRLIHGKKDIGDWKEWVETLSV